MGALGGPRPLISAQKIMAKKAVRKYDLQQEIIRLKRVNGRLAGEKASLMCDIFEELLTKMDNDVTTVGNRNRQCREWWIENVRGKSIMLHIALKKAVAGLPEWRNRTPPLFLSDDEFEERYGS